MMIRQIKDCPNCKEMRGWYEKLLQSYHQYYLSDGKASHAVENNTQGGHRKYCYECNRDITNCVGQIGSGEVKE